MCLLRRVLPTSSTGAASEIRSLCPRNRTVPLRSTFMASSEEKIISLWWFFTGFIFVLLCVTSVIHTNFCAGFRAQLYYLWHFLRSRTNETVANLSVFVDVWINSVKGSDCFDTLFFLNQNVASTIETQKVDSLKTTEKSHLTHSEKRAVHGNQLFITLHEKFVQLPRVWKRKMTGKSTSVQACSRNIQFCAKTRMFQHSRLISIFTAIK